jgi:hypothetical protein
LSPYSQLYIKRGRPVSDSKRARCRLYALFDDMLSSQERHGVEKLIRRELGVKLDGISVTGEFGFSEYVPDFEDFFSECELHDLLDAITLIYQYMKEDQSFSESSYQDWTTEVGRILAEENTAYRAGSDGIVRPFVDEEFEVNRASALDGASFL